MTDFRKLARGQDCMVRLPGCDGGGETTVLAHYRMAGYSGMGIKTMSDLATGAWACYHCHELVDGRVKPESVGMTREQVRLAHAEGVMRSVMELSIRGVI